MNPSSRTYYRRRAGYHRRYDAGREAARRHIEEAKAFSREIGGTDTDVKQYFFSLTGNQLNDIFREYGEKYGGKSEEYARLTFSRWRTGATKMSGTVAKRLFDLLPPRMPLAKKYELAQNVWKHFGPSSSHHYTVGPNANVSTVATLIAEKLDKVVLEYGVPETLQNRFRWLAAGDVRLQEQLLNHFRQLQKTLAVEKIQYELPVLQQQMHEYGGITFRARSTIQIHRHNISVWIDKRLGNEIRESAPGYGFANGITWFWWIIAALTTLSILHYIFK